MLFNGVHDLVDNVVGTYVFKFQYGLQESSEDLMNVLDITFEGYLLEKVTELESLELLQFVNVNDEQITQFQEEFDELRTEMLLGGDTKKIMDFYEKRNDGDMRKSPYKDENLE